MKNKNISLTTKIIIFKTVFFPEIMHNVKKRHWQRMKKDTCVLIMILEVVVKTNKYCKKNP